MKVNALYRSCIIVYIQSDICSLSAPGHTMKKKYAIVNQGASNDYYKLDHL